MSCTQGATECAHAVRHSKSTFSAASYATFRPSYPSALYNVVLAYHYEPKRLCVDLGCGTGIVTREMSKHFDSVIGIDPSAGMIRQARQSIEGHSQFGHVSFREGPAESIPSIEAGEVDLVTVGQAAHWFDQTKFWPEMQRLLRPKGTVACWGYKDHVFVDFPEATRIMQAYAYDKHPDKLGSYWPMPGRSYVQNKLRVLQPPATHWEEPERIEYEPATKGQHSGEGTLFMERSLTVAETKEYVRTWSSFHGWQEAHPEQKARSKGGDGDVMDEMFDKIAETDHWFKDETNAVNIEWGSALVLTRLR
ncbi:hypothetical protein BAUCODRAFT_228911 [Baudoinia panamericana UAMH 10762]|uniref:Methyltransferase type 11 domain-containing protein n=1 Tax=Baudoinia panamericana (strain UAMH 10762) TaxID=717646 RepID=M2MNV9_BAUPA|nr:uncharacterized protein BAUCODRAFT_228911 [Baudoinia panamericana UAMH 10762]EMC93133.1 hypothetical protein BAUCODRAFT_228911 [Baudoinia panamericana UAMH 10762]